MPYRFGKRFGIEKVGKPHDYPDKTKRRVAGDGMSNIIDCSKADRVGAGNLEEEEVDFFKRWGMSRITLLGPPNAAG